MKKPKPRKIPKGATSQEPPLTPDAMTAVLKAAYDAGLAEGRKTAQQIVYRGCSAGCPFCNPPFHSPFYNVSTQFHGTYTDPQ